MAMNASDEEQRREKIRALEQLRGQSTPQLAAVAKPSSPSGSNNQRGAKLRELLRQRQAGNTENSQKAGGGMLLRALAAGGGGGAKGEQSLAGGAGGAGGGALLRALANRGGGGGLGNQGGGLGGKGTGAGNRGELIRRLIQARQNRDGGGAPSQADSYAQQLAELQNQVKQLTDEIERLRAERSGATVAAPLDAPASGTKGVQRRRREEPKAR
jgi:hypothetical protein